MSDNELYLGDGAYARWNAFELELYTSDGFGKTNTVFLGVTEVQALVEVLKKMGVIGVKK